MSDEKKCRKCGAPAKWRGHRIGDNPTTSLWHWYCGGYKCLKDEKGRRPTGSVATDDTTA